MEEQGFTSLLVFKQMKSVFDRGHRAGVVIEDRHLLDLPDRANPQLAGVTEGSCRFSSALLLRWSAAALWKGRARGRKGMAPSDSALGTESDEPGLVTPVGRAGAPMFIVGGIHQADKSRHCCLVSLSTHVKSSRMETASTYTFLRKTHTVGP